ncbi:MAG TPA: hypothetical protein VL172_21140 [Kofleriaceae bacterium]|nr:hypothetical protein [Kofleriaceae bacterium]
MSGLATACVIPPPGDFASGDAGPSAPPVLLSAAPEEFAFPGVMTLDRGDQRRLILTLRDVDVDDTLFVRLFVDYGLPNQENSLSSCTALPTGEQTRVADCSTAQLCEPITDTAEHYLEAVVADREFLDEGDPPFRALPETGASSARGWIMQCNP